MEYWIWLKQIPRCGPILQKRLLDHFGSPNLIYDACKEELMSVHGIGEALAESILSERSLNKAYATLEIMEKKKIQLLTYMDPLYPSMAKEYAEAPILLYYRGSIQENMEGVAIVGSRRCSHYGKQIAIGAAEYLAHHHISVISGMAKGIDGYAHTSCLKNGGYTIACLGNGVDVCYPSEHIELMEAIIENGAVISEYPPQTKSRPSFFPKRNALISSWSKKILVVEAAEKSGALITAQLAKEQGREVLVPPHDIYSSTGEGTNRLLEEGAKIYLHPSQLLFRREPFSQKPVNKKPTLRKPAKTKEGAVILSLFEEKIIAYIRQTPKTVDEIGYALQIDQANLIECISIMELEGKVKSAAGRYVLA
jgi:DNA processing protein